MVVIATLASAVASAPGAEAPLSDRIEVLEKEIADLKQAADGDKADKKSLWSSLDVQFYGYIKADAAHDSSRTTTGNYVLYVDSEATRNNDREFNLTAGETRLGFNFTGPGSETMKTTGKVEFDFFGNLAAENKAKIQMRHAYMNLEWPGAQFSLLAGQTWDVISPLNPSTLNYPVLWEAGNIGYRRPQIRLTKGVDLTDEVSLKFQGAMVRTIGRTDPTNSETGEDAGIPTLQGRVGVTFHGFGPKPTTVGLSGHVGKEEYDIDATGRNLDFDSESINLDVTQPVCSWMTLKAELFSGNNLSAYLGGIGQGVNTTSLNEISSQGGWIAASLGPWSKWSFNVGAGVDNVDRDDVEVGGRTRNSCVFGNVRYAVNSHAQVGLELSQWDTSYKGVGDADNTRLQASFIYKF